MTEEITARRVLIVDDDDHNLRILARILRDAGFTDVRTEQDPRAVPAALDGFRPDVLLLDLQMPHMDGFEVLRHVRSRIRGSEYFPVLVISGDLSQDAKQRALSEGARDFLHKPYDRVEVVLRVRNLLEARDLNLRLEDLVRARTEQVRVTQLAVADRLALAAELRDYGRGAHTQRVGITAASVAARLGLPDADVRAIRRAAPLHDVGKIGIPDAILLKPGGLTPDEWDVLKTHTTLGASILTGSDARVLQVAEEIALYHHENWDGTGYTPGLGGDEIPLPARITAVADVFDALVRDRPYKHAWSVGDAVEWIADQKGKKFDPAVVDAFLSDDPPDPVVMLDDGPLPFPWTGGERG